MVHPHFRHWLLGGVAAIGAALLAMIALVDPYGVSPLRLELLRINAAKPSRADVDRLIKPYEIWRYQPKTVFLGTSRIHQAIDPAGFDGTPFAPAYNASIPASTLAENAAHLEQFFELNPRIRHVFLEIFLYNFVHPQDAVAPRSLSELASSVTSLFFGSTALLASLNTVYVNLRGGWRRASVDSRGRWIPYEGLSTAANFRADRNIDFIMRSHLAIPDMLVQPTAIATLDRIVELCRRHGAELHLLMTPNYPWDDYRLWSLGYWHLPAQLVRTLSSYPNVVSFSQYNDMVAEPSGPGMRWWYDPIHPSKEMGDAMLRALAGRPAPGTPGNFMRRVMPGTAESVIHERGAGLAAWITHNASYTTAFDAAKIATGNDRGRVGQPVQ